MPSVYIQDTQDFIIKIKDFPVPEVCLLWTADVSSLYTNIPQEEGIKTCVDAFEGSDSPFKSQFSSDFFGKIIRFVLEYKTGSCSHYNMMRHFILKY